MITTLLHHLEGHTCFLHMLVTPASLCTGKPLLWNLFLYVCVRERANVLHSNHFIIPYFELNFSYKFSPSSMITKYVAFY